MIDKKDLYRYQQYVGLYATFGYIADWIDNLREVVVNLADVVDDGVDREFLQKSAEALCGSRDLLELAAERIEAIITDYTDSILAECNPCDDDTNK